MSYVIVAEFRVRPDQIEAFRTYMVWHAARSREEPGCRLFEVAQDGVDPGLFLLYETYDDAAAYAAHRASAHYARFRSLAPGLVEPRDGEIFLRRSELTRCG
ncbi:MAG: putative quinol monooxygenase [Hyphomicrobiaceae bacterium]|jgi:quinol monooxygenase YgiN